MHIYTHCLFSNKNIFAQTRVSFIHYRNVLCGEIVPALIKHNNLGCDCLAGCWNQLTGAKSSLKNVHISLEGIGRLIYTSSWAKLIPMKLNDRYLNWGYVNFIIG